MLSKLFPGAHLKKEFIAGLTMFSTMVYAIVIIPMMLSEAGMDFSSVMMATILVTIFGTLLMGVVGNYPFALGPGIGMCAYFAYSVVLGQNIPWQSALGAAFVSGVILFLLWLFKLRELIIHAIPKGLKIGATAGIGLFLVVIALKNVHIVVPHPQTLMTLGNLASFESILSLFGVALIAALMAWRVQAAMLIGVLVNWMIGLSLGLVQWKGLISWPQFHSETFLQLNLRHALGPDLWLVIFSFLFIAIFDTSGTIMGLAHHGQLLDKQGKLPRLRRVLFSDTLATPLGAILGTCPSVVYLESAAGIAAGGKTGLTSVIVAFLYFVSLFFIPLAASIPVFAITPVLVVIGALMLKAVSFLDWEDPSDFIPCFVTVIGIPLTYSIGIGIGLGILLYPICKLFAGKYKQVHPVTWVLAALFAYRFFFF